MPSTGFVFPTTDAAVSGVWSNTTSVFANDSAVATTTIAAKNTTNVREQGGFGFSAGLVPSNASVTKVELQVKWRVTLSAGVIGILGARARVSATNLTLH